MFTMEQYTKQADGKYQKKHLAGELAKTVYNHGNLTQGLEKKANQPLSKYVGKNKYKGSHEKTAPTHKLRNLRQAPSGHPKLLLLRRVQSYSGKGAG